MNVIGSAHQSGLCRAIKYENAEEEKGKHRPEANRQEVACYEHNVYSAHVNKFKTPELVSAWRKFQIGQVTRFLTCIFRQRLNIICLRFRYYIRGPRAEFVSRADEEEQYADNKNYYQYYD